MAVKVTDSSSSTVASTVFVINPYYLFWGVLSTRMAMTGGQRCLEIHFHLTGGAGTGFASWHLEGVLYGMKLQTDGSTTGATTY